MKEHAVVWGHKHELLFHGLWQLFTCKHVVEI